MWMTSCTGSACARRILGILKKSVSWVKSCLGRRRLTFACSRRPWAGVARDEWGQIEKPEQKECVSLSLCRRTFKLKGNNKFRTWTKNRKCFSCFRVSRFLSSMYICYEHSNVRFTHSRIWLWYIMPNTPHLSGILFICGEYCRNSLSSAESVNSYLSDKRKNDICIYLFF